MSKAKIEFSSVLLRRLHALQQQRTELKDQIERGPRQIKAGEAMAAKAQADVDAKKDVLKKARLASDEKQLTLKTREDNIVQLQAKLNTAASNLEFDTFKSQIAADEQASSVLSDEILESFEHLDQLEGELKAAESELEKQQADQKKRIEDVEAKLVEVRSSLERVESELAESEKEIPSAARAVYVRLTESKGDEALAAIDDNSCGGCYQTLTTHVVDQLRLSIMVNCPNCNAFLYAPENTRVS